MHRQFVIALTLLFVFATGCGKRERTYRTAGGDVRVTEDGNEVTYEATTKEGAFKMAAGDKGIAVPDSFPKDVPILSGATVKVAMTQGAQMVVHLHAARAVADVAKFYQDELKGQGWEIETSMNMGDTSMLSAKKDKRQCSVVVAKEGNGALVQLAVSQEGK